MYGCSMTDEYDFRADHEKQTPSPIGEGWRLYAELDRDRVYPPEELGITEIDTENGYRGFSNW